MLDERTSLQILAVHAAVSGDSDLRDALIASVSSNELQRALLKRTWKAIEASACLRQLARGKKDGAQNVDFSGLEQRGDAFFWQEEKIGKLLTLYKPPLPQEWQARIAYESFLDRFVIYVQQTSQALLIFENDFCVQFFLSRPINISKLWQEFVQKAFSIEELLKTFVSLLNSVRLAESFGFSVLQVPVVSKSQAKLLSGFYLASMNARERGIKRLESEAEDIRKQIEEDKGVDKDKIASKQKKLQEISQKIKVQRTRYHKAIQAMQKLKQEFASEFNEIVQLARYYTQTASKQLKVTEKVVEKYVSETERLLSLKESDLYTLPPLLSDSPGTLLPARKAGDYSKNSCYVCGRAIKINRNNLKANKIILPSPSQTLQSRSTKENPTVCGTCAALAIASPIKLVSQSLVVRLFDRDTKHYLLEDQLRMFVLGELNVHAGRYLMLSCTEKIGKDSLMKEFGREPYALWKVATLFPADVFRSYRIEAIIEGAQILLPGRHLAWLSALMDIFLQIKTPYALENDKSKLTAVKKSLRHIQQEEVIFAIYELTQAFMAERQGGFGALEASRLEDLRALHVWWLENSSEESERRSRMTNLTNKARLFRDVAGLSGILYAFASRVRSEANQNQKDAEREVEKLLEKVDEPNHFIYDAAGGLQNTSARLWRGPDTHFIYDQAKALLEEAGVEVRESNENGKPFLQVFFDDINKVYTYLSERRYQTEKDWREFTYQVKLSLYARFPEYLGKKKEA
jgi:hypothetical protein